MGFDLNKLIPSRLKAWFMYAHDHFFDPVPAGSVRIPVSALVKTVNPFISAAGFVKEQDSLTAKPWLFIHDMMHTVNQDKNFRTAPKIIQLQNACYNIGSQLMEAEKSRTGYIQISQADFNAIRKCKETWQQAVKELRTLARLHSTIEQSAGKPMFILRPPENLTLVAEMLSQAIQHFDIESILTTAKESATAPHISEP